MRSTWCTHREQVIQPDGTLECLACGAAARPRSTRDLPMPVVWSIVLLVSLAGWYLIWQVARAAARILL